jgi:hypothetical protein
MVGCCRVETIDNARETLLEEFGREAPAAAHLLAGVSAGAEEPAGAADELPPSVAGAELPAGALFPAGAPPGPGRAPDCAGAPGTLPKFLNLSSVLKYFTATMQSRIQKAATPIVIRVKRSPAFVPKAL